MDSSSTETLEMEGDIEFTENNDDIDAKGWAESLVGIPPPVASMPVAKNSEVYNMRHKKRGKAVIFNHKEFYNGQSTRHGTDKDEHKLKVTLASIGFEVVVHRDLKRSKIHSALEELQEEDFSDSDCLLICVLSHGEEDKIFCADSEYRPEELWNPFTADRCPTLAGKPKIFFIQACRGNKLDSGTVLMKSRTATDGPSVKEEKIYIVPNRADFLIVYSTAPGYFSWRNTTEGSWFVQSLTKVIEAYKDKKDLLSMMTIVSREVALNFESNVPGNPQMDQKKQVPMISSTLIREVYF